MEAPLEDLEWFARKIFAFIVVPFFGYLGYYTQVRPYIISQHGDYCVGITDAVLIVLSLLVVLFFVCSKIQTLSKKNQT